MLEKALAFYRQHKEKLLYLFFGGCTTLINLLCYYLCANVLHWGTDASTIVSWIISVLFAYITNRIWVFESKETRPAGILREIGAFFSARIATGVMDWAIMKLFVDVLGLPDMPVKIASNVLVIILNYVFSKLIIFRKGKGEEKEENA